MELWEAVELSLSESTRKERHTAQPCCGWKLKSMTASLEISREQRVLRVTLNRPEKRNALNSEICGGIADAVEAAQQDETVGAIILDAKGEVFCAGMDLDEAILPTAADQTVIHQRLF